MKSNETINVYKLWPDDSHSFIYLLSILLLLFIPCAISSSVQCAKLTPKYSFNNAANFAHSKHTFTVGCALCIRPANFDQIIYRMCHFYGTNRITNKWQCNAFTNAFLLIIGLILFYMSQCVCCIVCVCFSFRPLLYTLVICAPLFANFSVKHAHRKLPLINAIDFSFCLSNLSYRV